MIFSKTVKVRDLNPLKYQPPRGIDVNWQVHDNELYATFTAGNVNQVQFIRDKYDINEALAKLNITQDRIRDYKTYRKVVPPNPVRQTWHDSGNGVKLDK